VKGVYGRRTKNFKKRNPAVTSTDDNSRYHPIVVSQFSDDYLLGIQVLNNFSYGQMSHMT
jgi:hypothetical protein